MCYKFWKVKYIWSIYLFYWRQSCSENNKIYISTSSNVMCYLKGMYIKKKNHITNDFYIWMCPFFIWWMPLKTGRSKYIHQNYICLTCIIYHNSFLILSPKYCTYLCSTGSADTRPLSNWLHITMHKCAFYHYKWLYVITTSREQKRKAVHIRKCIIHIVFTWSSLKINALLKPMSQVIQMINLNHPVTIISYFLKPPILLLLVSTKIYGLSALNLTMGS